MVPSRGFQCYKESGGKGGVQTPQHPMREFNNFIDDARLIDIEYIGAKYTWRNNQEGGEEVKQRIDRGLCNIRWASLYPKCRIEHKARAESDHCPIMLILEANNCRRGPRRFFYERGWKEVVGYYDCVEQSWQRNRSTSENLKGLSRKLKLEKGNDWGK
ncbi:hypothetical protein LINPERPRIM_LOCUS35687 [Linum perenne]